MFKLVALVLGLLGQNIVLADVAAQVPYQVPPSLSLQIQIEKNLLLIGSIRLCQFVVLPYFRQAEAIFIV